jgi:hypothetical protein
MNFFDRPNGATMTWLDVKKEIFLSLKFKWFLLTLNIWFSKSTLNDSGLFPFPQKWVKIFF